MDGAHGDGMNGVGVNMDSARGVGVRGGNVDQGGMGCECRCM